MTIKPVPLSRFPVLIDDVVSFLKVNEGMEHIASPEDIINDERLLEAARLLLREALGLERTPRALGVGEEVAATMILMLVAAALEDPLLTNRLTVFLAKRQAKYLEQLGLEELVAIAKAAGVNIETRTPGHKIVLEERSTRRGITVVTKTYTLAMRLEDFLRLTRRLRGDPNYRLTNRPLVSGEVYFAMDDIGTIRRLLEERLAELTEKKIRELGESPLMMRLFENEAFLSVLGEVKRVYETRRPSQDVAKTTLGTAERTAEATPPCLRKLLDDARSGANLSHHQRFVIAAFLGSIGVDKESIVNVFRNLPDFDEKVTRYQVEHILGERGGGKRYLPYSCDKMKVIGLCVSECNVRNPLQYYYSRLRGVRRLDRGKGEGSSA